MTHRLYQGIPGISDNSADFACNFVHPKMTGALGLDFETWDSTNLTPVVALCSSSTLQAES